MKMTEKQAYTLARAHAHSVGAYVQGGDKAAFHLCAPMGWINDPNGFSAYQGKVHLFFQHYPYASQWGPMHWGHAVTEDFVRWRLLPVALAPDKPYESGCFSGSALQAGDRHVLVYTSYLETADRGGLQAQSIALGDGIAYTKHPGNPVVSAGHLPPGASTSDFRDPKAWQEKDGTYRMAVANRAEDGSGQILLYESADLASWRYAGVIDQSRNQLGRMWECPDFFPLDGHQLLLISPQEMQQDPAGEFHGGSGTACLAGDWDRGRRVFTRRSVSTIDYGWDFYAPQTCLLPDGRRMMVAWMQSWDNNLTPAGQAWSGMMTFTRELRFAGGRLRQLPAREIARYYTNCQAASGVMQPDGQHMASGRQLDISLTVHRAAEAVFSLDVAASKTYCTRVTYNAPEGKLVLDRSRAGMPGDRYPLITMPLYHKPDEVRLRVLLDRWSLELFLNDGEQALTSLVYTPQEAQAVRLSAPAPLRYFFESREIRV